MSKACKLLFRMRFLVPALSFVASIMLIYMQMDRALIMAAILLTVISYLVADPFDTLAVALSRVTRWTLVIVITICSITAYAYYYDPDLDRSVITFVAACSSILLLIVIKLNGRWLDRDMVQDGPEVSHALVDDVSYKYNRFFRHYGRARCRSLLDFHLRKKTPDEEMDTTVRYIFNLGVACADDFSDMLQAELDEANEIIVDLEDQIQRIENAFDRKVKARTAASVESMKDQLTNKDNKIAGLQEAKRQLEAKVKELDKNVKLLDQNVKDKDEQLSRFDQICEENNYLRSDVSEKNKEYRELEAEYNHMCSRVEELEAENDQAQDLAQDYFKQINDMREYIVELENDAGAAFQDEMEELRRQNELLQEQIRSLEHQNEALQEEADQHPRNEKGGRPSIPEELIDQLIREYEEGARVPELVSKYGISKTKVYQLIKEYAS